MKEFPKKYDHTREHEVYKEWENAGVFNPDYQGEKKKTAKKAKDKQERFMMALPPPNVTGVLHVGHGLMLTVEDIVTRYQRMQGKKTLWLPATDHAGIATQVKVMQKLEKEGKTKEQLGRAKFVDEVWDWAKNSRSTII